MRLKERSRCTKLVFPADLAPCEHWKNYLPGKGRKRGDTNINLAIGVGAAYGSEGRRLAARWPGVVVVDDLPSALLEPPLIADEESGAPRYATPEEQETARLMELPRALIPSNSPLNSNTTRRANQFALRFESAYPRTMTRPDEWTPADQTSNVGCPPCKRGIVGMTYHTQFNSSVFDELPPPLFLEHNQWRNRNPPLSWHQAHTVRGFENLTASRRYIAQNRGGFSHRIHICRGPGRSANAYPGRYVRDGDSFEFKHAAASPLFVRSSMRGWLVIRDA